MSVRLADPYADLKALLARVERVFPRATQVTHKMMLAMAKFTIHNTVIEAKAMGVWRLNPRLTPAPPTVPQVHTRAVSRRWFIRKHTARTTHMASTDGGEDGRIEETVGIPRDARLWYPSDSVRKILLLAKHDMDLLFTEQIVRPTLPCCSDLEGTFTLLSTPEITKQAILYKDSMDILSHRWPYLARLCDEYAHTMCWLYGLTVDEFGESAHMYITRHGAGHGQNIELLETTDNGRYTGGPYLTVGVGRPHLFHDFYPVLATTEAPVRVKIGEGVLLVLDGCAKTRYSHGHPVTVDKNHYYTLNFQLDCLPRTLCTGIEKETHGLLTYTPFVPDHVVAMRQDSPSTTAVRMDSCPLWSILLEMHTRLKVAESHLLTRGYKRGASSPGPEGPERIRHPAS